MISELRPQGTEAKVYAEKIAAQIREMLVHKVPAENITGVGGSKGSFIAQYVSSALQNKKLNYVILAGCNESSKANSDVKLSGNVLSVYEASDTIGQSCAFLKSQSPLLGEFSEIKTELGIKHQIVFRPYPEWINPAAAWGNKFAVTAEGKPMIPETELSADKLMEKVRKGKVYLIDVRTPQEFNAGHLDEAKNIDFKSADFKEKIDNLDHSKPVFLYCKSGNRSGKAAVLLSDWGFKDVRNLGGFTDLTAKGLPAEKAE